MPGEANGRRRKGYGNFAALKPGIYAPLDGTLNGFDADFSGTLSFGEYTSETFAWGIDFSNMNTSFDGSFEKDEISANSAKLILTWLKPLGRRRHRKGEIYFNVGGGIYFVDVEVSRPGSSDKDGDEAYGLELGLGGNYNLSKRFFIGLEGKYIYTTDAEVFNAPVIKFSLEGYEFLASVGVRFNFIKIFRRR